MTANGSQSSSIGNRRLRVSDERTRSGDLSRRHHQSDEIDSELYPQTDGWVTAQGRLGENLLFESKT